MSSSKSNLPKVMYPTACYVCEVFHSRFTLSICEYAAPIPTEGPSTWMQGFPPIDIPTIVAFADDRRTSLATSLMGENHTCEWARDEPAARGLTIPASSRLCQVAPSMARVSPDACRSAHVADAHGRAENTAFLVAILFSKLALNLSLCLAVYPLLRSIGPIGWPVRP